MNGRLRLTMGLVTAALSLSAMPSARGVAFENVVDTATTLSADFRIGPNIPDIVVEETLVPTTFADQAGVQLRRVTPPGSDHVFQVNLGYGGSGGPGVFDLIYFLMDDPATFSDRSGTYVSLLTGRTIAYDITQVRDSGGGWEGTTSGHFSLSVVGVPDAGNSASLMVVGVFLAGWLRSRRMEGETPS